MDAREAMETVFFRMATAIGERLTTYQNTQVVQKLLYNEFRAMSQDSSPTPFRDAGFRCFSQTDEDGLLLYILAQAGLRGGRAVEVGFRYPVGSNITNLIVNHGWTGLGIEGDKSSVRRSELWFSRNRSTMFSPPTLVAAWVTSNSISNTLAESGFSDPDVLSIDVDGIDYWIWDALDCSPSVVVVEYNPMWDADTAVTVPVSPRFSSAQRRNTGYYGASLIALVQLGRLKGYTLVGTNHLGFNAFFVHESIRHRVHFETPSIRDELEKPVARRQREAFRSTASHLEWIRV